MSQKDDELERKKFLISTSELRIIELIEKLSERVEVNDQESRRRDEKIERNIEFVVQQQAQFTASMQQMHEAQARAEEKWERMWGRTDGSINSLLAVVQLQSQEIAGLARTQAEGQARTDKQIAETNERIAQTNERMAETGERLNALINVVERFISERRNGGNGNSA